MKNTLRLGVAAAAVALLTACGGGSDPAPLPTTPTETMPDSATASIEAFFNFASQLIADLNGSQTAQPLLLNDTPAPTSETAPPQPVS